MMEYLSLCRTCLNENLDDEYGTIFDICENEIRFSDILQLIAPQIDLNEENLTKTICDDCKNFCSEILKFKNQILNSNDTLQNPLKKEAIFEEIIANEDELKLQESYSVVEIEETESNLMLDEFPCDDMIVEVGEIEDSIEEFECKKCNKCFESEEILEKHIKSHISKSRAHFCNVCNKKFLTSFKLKYHEIIHSNLVKEIKSSNEEGAQNVNEHKIEGETDPLLCCHCGKSFDKLSALSRHLKTHNENEVN